MTGRWLYDKYADSSAARNRVWVSGQGFVPAKDLLAWPFLSSNDRDVWNDMARRITPKRKSRG